MAPASTPKKRKATTASLDAPLFRKNLMHWYKRHARVLPWRGVHDPYRTWISEIMLQQTRVQAVLEHYRLFLEKFPIVDKLAAAPEQDVLAAWSGLGYYRRARMMHAAARVIVAEHNSQLPQTAAALRTLPGIGEYTSAAIASIAFGESVPVVDGNVERVLLRVTGRPEDTTKAGKDFVYAQAAALVPPSHAKPSAVRATPPGDHNQAMMELGATICLPRNPLCLQCPVYALCITRGEHITAPRAKALKREIAYLFRQRKKSGTTEVLLTQRSADASLMAGMWELPSLSLERTTPFEPVLSVKHGITNTNYDVAIYSAKELHADVDTSTTWVATQTLSSVALTGLARKILRKMDVMQP